MFGILSKLLTTKKNRKQKYYGAYSAIEMESFCHSGMLLAGI